MSLITLARASGCHPLLIWDMLLAHPIRREDAHLILGGLNRLCTTTFTLADIQARFTDS